MSCAFDVEYEKLIVAAFSRFAEAVADDPEAYRSLSCKNLKFALAAATGQSPKKKDLLELIHSLSPHWDGQSGINFALFRDICNSLNSVSTDPRSGAAFASASMGRQLFASLDRRGRGYFLEEDLTAALSSAAPSLVPLSPVLFSSMDVYDLGKVTYNEFDSVLRR